MKDPLVEENTSQLLEFAQSLADAAKTVALSYFRNHLEVEHKPDMSPVTIADKEVELTMRKKIALQYPKHGILGEEHGLVNVDCPEMWVLDPIDGTKSFITGMPTFGTLIAFLKDGRPLISVVDMPAMGERWLGAQGKPTTLNSRTCQTRDCKSLSLANIYTTSPDCFNTEELEVFNAVSSQASLRRFGGDCYSYGLLASGYVDAVIEAALEPYDYLALVLVVEGAGGVITDWEGKPLTVKSNGRVVASASPELHAEILKIIQL
jgi:inositol-phosphate phosphatase/L-galactose 1-phosphate phosphatase/histidinol-phosphatase